MITKTKTLQQLISKLNHAEKTFFYKSHPTPLQKKLFEAYKKNIITNKEQQHYTGCRSLNQLAVLRLDLYDSLMSALYSYSKTNNLKYIIMEKLQQVEILVQKGLHEMAWQEACKLEMMMDENSLLSFKSHLIILKSKILKFIKTDQLGNEFDTILQKLEDLKNYYIENISFCILNLGITKIHFTDRLKTKQNQKLLSDIENSPYISSPTLPKYNVDIELYFGIKTMISFYKNEFSEFISLNLRYIKWVKTNQCKRLYSNRNYFIMHYNIQNVVNKISDMKLKTEALKVLDEYYKEYLEPMIADKNENIVHAYSGFKFLDWSQKLQLAIDRGNRAEIKMALSNPIIENLETMPIEQYAKVQSQIAVSMGSLMIENYEQAIYYIQFATSASVQKSFGFLYVFARIMEVLIYYDLHNDILVQSRLLMLYRHTSKYDSGVERIVFNFIRSVQNHCYDKNKLNQRILKYLKQVEKAQKKQNVESELYFLDIRKYLESKLYNKKLIDVYKEKYLESLTNAESITK